MKKRKIVILLSILIVLGGCLSNEKSTLVKQENIKSIIKELQKSFPEDAPVFKVSLNSCEKLVGNFCNADITYKRGTKYYDITYDDVWTDPIESTRTISTPYLDIYKNITEKKITDFTFNNIEEIYNKVCDQLEKEHNNNIDKFALVSITEQVGLKGGYVFDLIINVTKKDDVTQRRYDYKRLNGVGKKRRCLVITKKYYSVYVFVNENGEIKKNVDFSRAHTYEETTL